MTDSSFVRLLRRAARGICLIVIVAGTCVIWHFYGPLPGVVGTPLQRACYLTAGVIGVTTALHPLTGLVMLCLVTPVLNAIPLYLSDGATYPILLFAGIAFICGWLLRETVHVQRLGWFRGAPWWGVFLVLTLISGAASFTRYNPLWQWRSDAFNAQPVNVTMLSRLDAIRFVVFTCADVWLGLALILAVSTIVQRYGKRSHGVSQIILWALLFGAGVSAAAAVYQGWYNINFCANRAYYWTRLMRANGFCADPNALGALLALLGTVAIAKVSFAGSLLSLGGWVQRAAALLLVVVFIIALQHSGSRSGFLGIVIAGGAAVGWSVLYYGNIILRRFKVPTWGRLVCAIVVVTTCVLAVREIPAALRYVDRRLASSNTSSALVRRFKRDLRLFQQEGNVWDMMRDPRRLLYWRYARIMWQEFPLTGIGLGSYVIELPNYCAAANERLFRTDNACNYYLHYAAEMGTPALAVLLFFYGTLLAGFFGGAKTRVPLTMGHRHHRIVLAITFITFLIVLIFGVHTMAAEVNIAFAIVVGLVSADHATVREQSHHLPQGLRLLGGLIVTAGVVSYAWRLHVLSAGVLNGERRMATFALGSEGGWYAWEQLEGVPFRVRWTQRSALTVMPRLSNRLGLYVLSNDPSVTTRPQIVTIYVNGEPAKQHVINVPDRWELLDVTVPYANAFQYCGTFHTAIRVEVSRTWVPRKVTGWDDDRELGVLVSEPQWLEPEGAAGGWYDEETGPEGMRYRWSSRYAWQRLYNTTNSFLSIPMYAANIQLRRWPLRVAIFLNRAHLDTVTLTDKRWREYRYPLPNETPTNSDLLVEVVPSRTWVPRHYGFDDYRELGVAVGRMRLE